MWSFWKIWTMRRGFCWPSDKRRSKEWSDLALTAAQQERIYSESLCCFSARNLCKQVPLIWCMCSKMSTLMHKLKERLWSRIIDRLCTYAQIHSLLHFISHWRIAASVLNEMFEHGADVGKGKSSHLWKRLSSFTERHVWVESSVGNLPFFLCAWERHCDVDSGGSGWSDFYVDHIESVKVKCSLLHVAYSLSHTIFALLLVAARGAREHGGVGGRGAGS